MKRLRNSTNWIRTQKDKKTGEETTTNFTGSAPNAKGLAKKEMAIRKKASKFAKQSRKTNRAK